MGFSEKETAALDQFRVQTQGLMAENAPDHFLIRWLRARNLDLSKAKDMLSNYLDWIKNNKNLPLVTDWTPPKKVVDDFPYKFLGEDHDSRPVLWMPVGKWEIKKLFGLGYKDDSFRFAYQIMDELIATIDLAREKSAAEQFVGILDMSELSLGKLNFEVLQCAFRFFREIESYYPELIHAIYVINAHYVFSIAFNFVKPIMSSHTLSKVKVFDCDSSKWKPILLNDFPANIIPEDYGGTAPPLF